MFCECESRKFTPHLSRKSAEGALTKVVVFRSNSSSCKSSSCCWVVLHLTPTVIGCGTPKGGQECQMSSSCLEWRGFWFHFSVSSLVLLPIPVALSVFSLFCVPRREAGDVWCLPPVWNLRAVIWFHFAISSLVLLPIPVALSVFSLFCVLMAHSPYFFFPEKSLILFIKKQAFLCSAWVAARRSCRWYVRPAAISLVFAAMYLYDIICLLFLSIFSFFFLIWYW